MPAGTHYITTLTDTVSNIWLCEKFFQHLRMCEILRISAVIFQTDVDGAHKRPVNLMSTNDSINEYQIAKMS